MSVDIDGELKVISPETSTIGDDRCTSWSLGDWLTPRGDGHRQWYVAEIEVDSKWMDKFPSSLIVSRQCTIIRSGPSYPSQASYSCLTCSVEWLCVPCAYHCHALMGHDVTLRDNGVLSTLFCDCKDESKCELTSISEPPIIPPAPAPASIYPYQRTTPADAGIINPPVPSLQMPCDVTCDGNGGLLIVDGRAGTVIRLQLSSGWPLKINLSC
jgi:hypothetical protein